MKDVTITERLSRRGDVSFIDISLTKDMDGLATLQGSRIIMTGKPFICIMEGNPKFGDQLQFSMYNEIGTSRVEKCDNIGGEKWERIEINVSLRDGIRMIQELNRVLILKGLVPLKD